MRYTLPLITFVLLFSACSGSGSVPAGEPAAYQGTIKRICSPVDAAGRELRLEKQAGSGPPVAIIQFWSPLPAAGPEPVELTGSDNTGSLMVCQSEQDCQLLQRGFVLIEAENALGPSTGLFWSANGQVHGRFSVEPIAEDNLICG